MITPKPLMTVAEYAAHRGCSDSYVRRLRRDHRLKVAVDGLIDVVGSDAMLASSSDPLRGGDRTAPAPGTDIDDDATAVVAAGDISLREAMRRERLARARLAELELGEEARQLVRAKDVDREVFTAARQAVERLRSMGSRLRKSLAAESDPAECEAMLNKEAEIICTAMQKAAEDMVAARAAAPIPAQDREVA